MSNHTITARGKDSEPGPLGIFLGLTLAVGLCSYGSWIAWKQWSLVTWPATVAEVLEFQRGVDPDWGGHWYANPTIRFRYQVNGVNYEGTQLNPSQFNYQIRGHLDSETGHLKVGAMVPCWHHPDSPAEAYVVNVGITTGARLTLALGLLLLAGVCNGMRKQIVQSRSRHRQAGACPTVL